MILSFHEQWLQAVYHLFVASQEDLTSCQCPAARSGDPKTDAKVMTTATPLCLLSLCSQPSSFTRVRLSSGLPPWFLPFAFGLALDGPQRDRAKEIWVGPAGSLQEEGLL